MAHEENTTYMRLGQKMRRRKISSLPCSPMLDTLTTAPTSHSHPPPARTTSPRPPTQTANRQPRDTCNLSAAGATFGLRSTTRATPAPTTATAARAAQRSASTADRCRSVARVPARQGWMGRFVSDWRGWEVAGKGGEHACVQAAEGRRRAGSRA
jgi:hypothetical protein